MRFEPKSDQELYKLLPEGDYDFEVLSAVEKTSQKGNEMIEVVVKVYGTDKEHTIKDWIVDGAKLKRFCEAVGMSDAYMRGELPADAIVGASGKCKVVVEQSEQYGDRNKVAKYIPAKAPQTSPNALRTEGVPASQTKAAMQRAAAGDVNDDPF